MPWDLKENILSDTVNIELGMHWWSQVVGIEILLSCVWFEFDNAVSNHGGVSRLSGRWYISLAQFLGLINKIQQVSSKVVDA